MLKLALSLAVAASTAQLAAAHASILEYHGQGTQHLAAFGVDLTGRFPRHKGQAGDPGADVTRFLPPNNISTQPCGEIWSGPIDVTAALQQAEGFGVPQVYANGSVVMTVFQVNRDGGGPMMCEVSTDASLKSFQMMNMDLNMAGMGGIYPQDLVNQTVVTTMPKGARCTGGNNGDLCIVRCRAGVNAVTGVQYRFGGCFAVRMDSAAPGEPQYGGAASNSSSTAAPPSSNSGTCQDMSDSDLAKLTASVVAELKRENLVMASSAAAHPTSAVSSLASAVSSSSAVAAGTTSSSASMATASGMGMGGDKRASMLAAPPSSAPTAASASTGTTKKVGKKGRKDRHRHHSSKKHGHPHGN